MLTLDLRRLSAGRGHRVLDVGCGAGRHSFACAKAGADIVALDASSDEVKKVDEMFRAMIDAGECQGPANGVVADASALPLRDSAFDAVIGSEVLEHLIDDVGAISELARVLRPGGVLGVSVPREVPERVNWALSRRYHEVDGGHVRIYRRRDLVRRLEEAGLEFVGIHHAHGLHTPYWWLRCAVGIDREDHAVVRAYHRLLVWDLMKRPLVTRCLDALLNPVIGKSLVVYYKKPASS